MFYQRKDVFCFLRKKLLYSNSEFKNTLSFRSLFNSRVKVNDGFVTLFDF